MALDPGDSFVLDDDDATVEDVITVTQGSGEDAESWPLRIIVVGGRQLLIEEYQGKSTLYERGEVRESEISVIESDEVRYEWNMAGGTVTGHYLEGTAPGGDGVLLIDGTGWIEDDGVVPAGRDGEWLARAHTPAADLRRAPTSAPAERPGRGAVWADGAVALALTVYVAAALFLGVPGFRPVWWIAGGISLAGASSSPRFALHRSCRIVAFAFGLWLVTDMAYHLAPEPVAGGWDMGRALFFLAAAWPPFLLHRRTFHMVTDAAVWGAVASVVVFTGGFLLFAFIDEDLGWLRDWGWYFGKPAYAWLWLALFAGALLKYRKDYRRLPLDAPSFEALRRATVARLRRLDDGGDLLEAGRGLDDLADALRLCEDPDVAALDRHQPALAAAGDAAVKLAKSGFMAGEGDADDRAHRELLRRDGETMAEDLASLAPAGPALRISPILRWRALKL